MLYTSCAQPLLTNLVLPVPAMIRSTILLLAYLLLGSIYAHAQCDDVAQDCSYDLLPFNSDGQFYRAQLFPGEQAKMRITFYEGIVYRIVPCSEDPKSNPLVFTLYDKRGNKLFSNAGTLDQRAWDFAFGATADYLIEVSLGKPSNSGCVAIQIGYKEMDDEEDDYLEFGTKPK
jgi:hypothetical protein